MKKPDRYERMVKAWGERLPSGQLIDLEPHIVTLLRREHAWMVRMVKRIHKQHPYSSLIRDLTLTQLEKRKL